MRVKSSPSNLRWKESVHQIISDARSKWIISCWKHKRHGMKIDSIVRKARIRQTKKTLHRSPCLGPASASRNLTKWKTAQQCPREIERGGWENTRTTNPKSSLFWFAWLARVMSPRQDDSVSGNNRILKIAIVQGVPQLGRIFLWGEIQAPSHNCAEWQSKEQRLSGNRNFPDNLSPSQRGKGEQICSRDLSGPFPLEQDALGQEFAALFGQRGLSMSRIDMKRIRCIVGNTLRYLCVTKWPPSPVFVADVSRPHEMLEVPISERLNPYA
jgi:hypothetical protein